MESLPRHNKRYSGTDQSIVQTKRLVFMWNINVHFIPFLFPPWLSMQGKQILSIQHLTVWCAMNLSAQLTATSWYTMRGDSHERWLRNLYFCHNKYVEFNVQWMLPAVIIFSQFVWSELNAEWFIFFSHVCAHTRSLSPDTHTQSRWLRCYAKRLFSAK